MSSPPAASTIDRVQSAQPGALREGPGVVARVAPACAEGEEAACEEQAHAREQDPRRQEALQAARALMAGIFNGPPQFTDLTVTSEWTG
jgi:hypothetical protein